MPNVRTNLVDAVERMPAFPKSVHQVLKLASDINCSQKCLVEIIKKDPVFTLKILRLVNSAYFGLSREVTSINHASVYLGLNTLKNVALGLAAVGAMPRANMAGLDMDAFWLHSLAVATATRMLGGMLGVSQDEAADYFAAGLLHDIGKVVLALYMAEEFEDVGRLMDREGMPMYEAEMAVLGATHADVGAMLAVKWNLPVDLGDAIARHHTPDQGDRSQLVDCVFAADQISKKLCFGSSGNLAVQPLPAPVRARFGLDLDGLIAGMPTLDQEVGEARIFIRLGEAD
ncbi:MAG: HDOD domain-containing protein [Pseudodesulfovibrio sp.]|uniref:Metal-dependent hydrolase HDOD n=1 Tax=Pseudodesulfovibrio aespoeensis (strain ATCC 700646 / DSM 10631 / Aspo-2) TaxID=643562 RepID=E6VU17_PSEA9|nr:MULTISPECIES: HDOD domain-containing protein [Pseudodesulfovibrio]MBU4243192.1 HDOD domain-containing protein [Pseudomonadota bacterium]ADU62210.1 Metal-dependent hydrolase HDOD [Pseudodesulfovibrio aespoeensis Aspo-2]MBU4377558.1 HDOD domain-containing protein [Pseudomonadota bacterium]MBU4476101.1 HDOD domain-containing protein [Pseudomonadota bacterium]MBU4515323.1 HDOD domain-containing protein [Pseudomonadota bacterium]